MSCRYVADVSKLPDIAFRPAMIESAWSYCDAVIKSGNKLSLVGETLAALAIEIVLKSFSAEVAANEGRLNEKYKFVAQTNLKGKDRHNLCHLAGSLHPAVRKFLFNEQEEAIIAEHACTFTEHRYAYETTAPSCTSDSAIKLAIKIVCDVVYLYKQRGCADPFISDFPVDQIYFRHVQPMMYVRI